MNYSNQLLAKKVSNELQHTICDKKYQTTIIKQLLAKKMSMKLQQTIDGKKDVNEIARSSY